MRASGELRVDPIDGLRYRLTRPVPHEDGHVIEIARDDWDLVSEPIRQVHMTTTLPGRVRAWGLHRKTTDRLFVASGLVHVVCWDGRKTSPTFGRLNEFTLSDRNPGLVVIPPDVYHGWKNIGTSEAIVVNMPTRPYTYDEPDALDLPWDAEAAKALIPYRW
ncbi:MAG: dTDP-4-dehydrorhamnose 3,5-epimerase family protein [Thermoanaerobaculia bacterium]|nr:dTDP-4-dehydrorhamnose 3,5-epimerase family protein [Thermoanaerobaculia bacterium]